MTDIEELRRRRRVWRDSPAAEGPRACWCARWCASAITNKDSYFGQGQGETEWPCRWAMSYALRHALWLATDTAYKEAGEALAKSKP